MSDPVVPTDRVCVRHRYFLFRCGRHLYCPRRCHRVRRKEIASLERLKWLDTPFFSLSTPMA